MEESVWEGTKGYLAERKDSEFCSSVPVDGRLYFHDIVGSIAYADMLAAKNVITHDEADEIADGLIGINNDMDAGKLQADTSSESICAFLEEELVRRIGETGCKLSKPRSRAEQESLDLRLYLRDECDEVKRLLMELITAVTAAAEKFKDVAAPEGGCSFGHHLLAYAFMLKRDYERLGDAAKRMNYSPVGPAENISCDMVAASLGFDGIVMNSLDSQSDRDFCVEMGCCFSLIMTHLSRFAGEILLWSGEKEAYLEQTGKSSRLAELVCCKAGRVNGALMTLLSELKGAPLSRENDLQEEEHALFDSLDTAKSCLKAITSLLQTIAVRKERDISSENIGGEWMGRELEYVQGWLTGIRSAMAQQQRDMAQQMME